MERALIIVPHQDDEINIAGNVIGKISLEYEIFILYSSLDADKRKGCIRKKEAINAAIALDINVANLIFLDYPDTSNKVGHHFYTDGASNIENQIEAILFELRPQLIIATDFDYHSDHRMLSIAFEKALNILLHESIEYRPIVLKGFCYETAYYGVEDYCASRLDNCIVNKEILSNASFEWDDRVSISSIESSRLIWKRKAFKALAAHKSQYAILHARSIINADNVFWQRRTDNLLVSANISASSGNYEKVRDFQIIDTDDLITINPREIKFSKSMWMPNDTNPWIEAKWSNSIEFDKIVFYGNPNITIDQDVEIEIYADTKKIAVLKQLKKYARKTEIVIPKTKCSFLRFVFLGENIGISEIEVLFGKQRISSSLLSETINKKRNYLLDIVDVWGFNIIVFILKVKRKIKKIL